MNNRRIYTYWCVSTHIYINISLALLPPPPTTLVMCSSAPRGSTRQLPHHLTASATWPQTGAGCGRIVGELWLDYWWIEGELWLNYGLVGGRIVAGLWVD